MRRHQRAVSHQSCGSYNVVPGVEEDYEGVVGVDPERGFVRAPRQPRAARKQLDELEEEAAWARALVASGAAAVLPPLSHAPWPPSSVRRAAPIPGAGSGTYFRGGGISSQPHDDSFPIFDPLEDGSTTSSSLAVDRIAAMITLAEERVGAVLNDGNATYDDAIREASLR